ncbi:thioredoxin family protein [Gilvimarinus polysaccharolyticus]|uniref:thioredoxin family protein n=1 Tax=Gilvimarinus polysaccharolyticus TaxID=863921 RepID=UPI00067380D0|nr:thioredoxin family protein [Gilvimarinus polysaccharolyticus]
MKFSRFFAPITALLVLFSITLSADALEAESFTKERFEALQAEGAPILVDVYATWCPTCAKQRKVLETYQSANPDSKLVILEVDFDDQKEWVKHFKAPRQSTLLLFDGTEQVWFSVAETREDKIFAAIDELLGQ